MKNAIITGSSKGLGKVIARRLADDGYRVWLSGRDESALKKLTIEITEHTPGEARYHTVDFNVLAEVQAYANRLVGEIEVIDVLVNNVGVYQMDEVTDELVHLDRQMSVNFRSPVELTQILLERFKNQRSGYIFNIASVVNRQPRASASSYSMAKAAFFAYHKVLHERMKPLGVKVTAFLPASINTSSWDGIEAPKQSFIQPEDIAALMMTTLNMKTGTVVSEVDLAAIHPEY